MQTIKNYIDGEKRRREEEGEKGFSLIELIIVVVILGILAAIAIPIFLNIQQDARENAALSVAANGATQAAAALAQDEDVTVATFFDNLETSADTTLEFVGTPSEIDKVCVSATVDSVTAHAGPGCTTPGIQGAAANPQETP